jgi:RimJ/RimL family protein N-acetyltransferase
MPTPRDALPESIAAARLTLRTPVISDIPDLTLLANNWNVVRSTAWLPYPYLEEHARGFLERVVPKTDQCSYAIVDGEQRPIGVIALKFYAEKPPELSYWLGEAHWGKGYAPEAVRALVGAAAGTGGIEVINARVLDENPASRRALEKAGFAAVEHTQSIVDRHRGKPLTIMQWRASRGG